MSVFPLRSPVEDDAGEPRILDIQTDDADAVFGALSSETARRVYGLVADEPRTASDIADELDSSIQNIRYHLDNLKEAGLVEVVDVWYSSRGSEMDVYGTVDGPLVVMAGDDETGVEVRDALKTVVGGSAAFGLVGLLINYLTRPTPEQGTQVGAMGQEAASTGLDWIVALPGLLFALGGVIVLLGLTGYLIANSPYPA